METEDDHGRGGAFRLCGVHDRSHGVPSLGDEANKLRSCLSRRRPAERVIDVGPECCLRLVR